MLRFFLLDFPIFLLSIEHAYIEEKAMVAETVRADKKFWELILYVARKSESDESFGATKLNKILFYADFLAFAKTGSSITGQKYVKLEFGPAPAQMKAVREGLFERKDAALQHRDHFGHTQDRLVALREPDLSLFSGAEIAIVDEILERFRSANAAEVSEFSHRFVGWQIARLGEEIPYETVHIRRREPTEKENAYAMTLKPTLKDATK